MSEPTSGSAASSPNNLPPNPSAEFLHKLAKERLRAIRQTNPGARLFEAQLAVAREHGFDNWRDMMALLNRGRRGNVRREGSRVQIDGVAPLQWCGSDCTLLAAMSNVLKVIGPEHDYARLFGDSALAFRTRLWASDSGTESCPSSPVAEFAPWTDYLDKSIGWTTRWDVRMKPKQNEPHDMSELLDEITASIDAGLPVLGYFKSWDMGIAYGYEGSQLLIRDYMVGNKEGTVEVTDCRGLLAFFEQRTAEPSREESARFAINEAVSRWSHPPDRWSRNGVEGAYYYGADAYDRWTALLDRAGAMNIDAQKALLHVDYWTFIHLHDARQKAAPYLRSVVELFPHAADSLKQAAEIYQRMGEMTGQVIHDGKIFPAFYQPNSLSNWTPEVRKQEIALLQALRRLDEQAIAQLRSVPDAAIPVS